MQKNISIIADRCFGCRSCEQACPVSAISMISNKEGYIYPIVNNEKCVQCGMCLNACPAEHSDYHREKGLIYYAYKNDDSAVRKRSASGGASYLISENVLNNEGVVYGAAYNSELNVEHIRVDSIDELCKTQSSKYVQSDTNNIYTQIKIDLKTKKVLFTGTPCQVSGLYAFLGGDHENLYTADIICHGVPSPLFFKKYLKYLENKIGEPIVSYDFRAKNGGNSAKNWEAHGKTRSLTGPIDLDKYGCHFSKGDCFRECCYTCPFTNMKRVGDVTLGDYWGVDKYDANFNDGNGISSISINTAKGKNLFLNGFNKCNDTLLISRIAYTEAQGNLLHPTKRPTERNEFYKDIESDNFVEKLSVPMNIKMLIKHLMPYSLIRKLKKFKRR